MKLFYSLLISMIFVGTLSAQTIDELKAMKSEKSAKAAELQKQLNALNSEVSSLQSQINNLAGWRTSISGLAGFNLSNSTNWIASPNPDAKSTGLNLDLAAEANYSRAKYFWNNKLKATKAWQDVDLKSGEEDDDLFDNGTADILNFASLGGYKFSPKLAASVMVELNTSVESFFEPATLDIGAGVTWLPIQNMTVVVHPLNYNIKFPEKGLEDIETTGTLGAKLRVDYSKDLILLGKRFAWKTALSSFLPYSSDKTLITPENGEPYEATTFEYTWYNTVSFEIWKGIGVGLTLGLRDARFEIDDLQTVSGVGLTYGF